MSEREAESQVAKLEVNGFVESIALLRSEIAKAIVGNRSVIDGVLSCMLAGGHALLEGVPGLGKTFTPDLMPADILGTTVIEETAAGAKSFEFRKGPIFANILLADEINRATPKTQSALLEAMAEHRVSVGRKTHTLDEPFVVLATQNPLEMEGTYPLPEAQLDRFLFKLHVPFPGREELHEILDKTTGSAQPGLKPVLDRARLLAMQDLVRRVPVARHVQDYAIRLIQATHPPAPEGAGRSEKAPRNAPNSTGEGADLVRRFVRFGASPRGAQALLLTAKIRALFDGRFAASIDDIRAVAHPALRHRMLLNFEGEAEGIKTDQILDALILSLPETLPETARDAGPKAELGRAKDRSVGTA
jgi:MoxR-like ATPase